MEPEDCLTVHAFASNLNNGGYALVAPADAGIVLSSVSKSFSWNDIEVVPVADVTEAVPTGSGSLAWARAAADG